VAACRQRAYSERQTRVRLLAQLSPLFVEALIGQALRLLLILAAALLAGFVARTAGERALRKGFLSSLRQTEEDDRRKRAETLAQVLSRSASWIIYLIAGFTILGQFGINLMPVLAGFGVVGIAIGFGAQSLVRDLVNGLFIITENQYSRGDIVTVADRTGVVEHMNWRRTVLRDDDGVVHHITHGQITVVSNHTREWSRVRLIVGVPRTMPLEDAMAALDDLGREVAADVAFAPQVMETPQVLQVESLGSLSYALKLQGTTRVGYGPSVAGELRRRILVRWPQHGVTVSDAQSERQTGAPRAE